MRRGGTDRRAQLVCWYCGTVRMWKDKLLLSAPAEGQGSSRHTLSRRSLFPLLLIYLDKNERVRQPPACQGDLPPAPTFSPSSQQDRNPARVKSMSLTAFIAPVFQQECPAPAVTPRAAAFTPAK